MSVGAGIPPIKDLSTIATENNPHRVALGNGIDGPTWTWEEFDRESKRGAQAIHEHASQGDRVAFLCESSAEHTILWNAGVKAGCIVSNLHTRASTNTLRTCLRKLKPRILVIEGEYSEFVEQYVYEQSTLGVETVVTLDTPKTGYERSMDAFLEGQPATEPDVRIEPSDIVAVQWTSGTTGAPKGWAHSNEGLVLRGMKLAHKKKFNRLTRVANIFTPSFSAWYSTAIPAILSNASMFFYNEWDPEGYLELVEERELTSTNLVPTMWREILRLDTFDEYDLSSFETIEVGGETLDTTTLKRLQEHICESVTQSYAATEVVGTSISSEEMVGDRIDSVGKPLLGTRIRVIERGGDHNDTLPPGEMGEVIVKGGDAPVWAWNDTEKTRKAFREGWWYSGDLGYKDEDGYLYIEGRADNMIMSKGIKVFPTPVEERLNDHPDVVESAVIGLEDDEYGEKVTAIITTVGDDIDVEELDQWCLDSDDLSRIERPREYHFFDKTLPRTASGKLDRKEIEGVLD